VQDPDAKASCLECYWRGAHEELIGYKKETS
jgi:hypothetical protein